jgi:hypothetical protein
MTASHTSPGAGLPAPAPAAGAGGLTALLSVSDKTGVAELARALHALGVRLVSTGGTARLVAEAGLPVTEVAALTR